MFAIAQRDVPVAQFATDRPTKHVTPPVKRLLEDSLSPAVIAIIVLFAVIGYVV